MNPDLRLSQFDYELPPELIAQAPAAQRSGSRLLHVDGNSGLHDLAFTDLPTLLRRGDLLVFNDTRVIKARLHGNKESGGRVELLVERIIAPRTALAHIKASKSPRAHTRLRLADAFDALVTGREGELFVVEFPDSVLTLLQAHGHTPLPPYISHAASDEDDVRYQTVYARKPGAVAAPTAGLHFDEDMLATLATQGVESAFVTLHVGAGTFQPVRVEHLTDHVMHAEYFHVDANTLQRIASTREHGGRVVAVGTTSVRALESAAAWLEQQSQQAPHGQDAEGDTRLFITPGYRFRLVDALITNFHLPQSTLLMLVAALAGMEPMRRAYMHAVQSRYRFFSYGDAMFIESPNRT